MIEHRFLQGGEVHETDLRQVLDLSAIGVLEWGHDGDAAAIGSNVAYSTDQATAEAANLLEVRVGYIPPTPVATAFNYLRLTGADGEQHYVADDSNPGLIPVAQRVMRLGFSATNRFWQNRW